MNGVEQTFNKGQVIIKQGQEGDRIFRILSGQVIVCVKKSDGSALPLESLGPGEIFGEMYLMSDDRLRNASAFASEDTVLEVFFEEDVKAIYSKLPSISRQLTVQMAERLETMTQKYLSKDLS